MPQGDEHGNRATHRSNVPYSKGFWHFMAKPSARVTPWKQFRHPPNEEGLGSHPIVQIDELINKGHLKKPVIFCEGGC